MKPWISAWRQLHQLQEITMVEIDVDKDAEDVDHYIKPEERFALAMAIQ